MNIKAMKPVIELQQACLEIPVKTRELRTLKKSLIRSFTGGKLHKISGGALIEALNKISCAIYRGERVALIGHNGAGKSTFLRLISGIYKPSSGIVRTSCSVFPMIERNFLTSPELSGVQAVKAHYLMLYKNLKGFGEYLEEIVEFSELGDYIHMPMKGYSSGMLSRLLFSMLTAKSHECLALDEGFGTGDSHFFNKAQERMESFINNSGTLLLASHSDTLLRQFCKRGIVFQEGRIVFDGSIEEALIYYHKNNA